MAEYIVAIMYHDICRRAIHFDASNVRTAQKRADERIESYLVDECSFDPTESIQAEWEKPRP